MANDKTQIALIGACAITVDAVDYGYTGKDGVKVNVEYETVDAQVGKFGGAAIDVYKNIKTVTAEFMFAQSNWALFEKIFPSSVKVTNTAGSSKLTLGKLPGFKMVPFALVLTPYVTAMAGYALNLWRVISEDAPEIVYGADHIQYYKVKLRALVDDTKADGNYFGTYGDTTIVADIVAPTVSGVVPADAAAGQSVNTTIVWTFSEALDPGTVNERSFLVLKTPVAVGTPTALGIAGAVTIDATNTIVTFTPTVALTAAKTYVCIVTSDVKDVAGNRLGGGAIQGQVSYATDFATA